MFIFIIDKKFEFPIIGKLNWLEKTWFISTIILFIASVFILIFFKNGWFLVGTVIYNFIMFILNCIFDPEIKEKGDD